MYQLTTATLKLAKLNKRLRGIAGGTSAGKTISILQILIHQSQIDKRPTITSVTSESMPHLRRGAMRDFISILKEHNYYDDTRWNKSEFTYTFETGSKIEFFSLDMPHKVRGPRRSRLFINEANNIPFETFDQLEVRTNNVIWCDWNPTNEFWWYTEVMPKRNDFNFEILTYKDNEGLSPEIIQSIESHKQNKGWWQVYGEGQLGEVEGIIYKGWNFIDSIPPEARLERYGLDFGYTNDPSAIISIWKWNDAYIINEEAYTKGLSNKQIADLFTNLPRALIIADSAEPKSIDEIKGYGHLIVGSQKGPGSVNQGIQYVQEQKIFVTKTSINTIKEYRNYMWLKDKDGKILNEPSGVWDHTMSAIRYGLDSFRRTKEWKPSNVGGMTPYISGTLA